MGQGNTWQYKMEAPHSEPHNGDDTTSETDQGLPTALDFALPDIDAVSHGYERTLLNALLFLLIPTSVLVALIIGLVWGLFAMLANFSHTPNACFWGAIMDATVLLFLLKPLFLRPEKTTTDTGCDRYIGRDDEPLLYAYVDKLCQRIGAPTPDTIVLSLDATVSARITSLTRDRLELTLGLPLMSVFPQQVLIAILIHELGRFQRRSTMCLSSIYFYIHRFLHRSLYQRDAIDRFFQNLRNIRNIYFMPANLVISVVTESMRGVSWLLLVGGISITCRADREMELDADRFAARLAGRDEMTKALEALHFAAIGVNLAMRDVNASMQERALPDDMVRLAVADALSMIRYKDEIFAKLQGEETHWDSSHPCFTDRINNIADIENTGTLHADTPSTELIRDFSAVCQTLSRQYYSHQLGDLRKRIAMVSSQKLAAHRIHSRQGRFQVQCYFRTGVGINRRILPIPRLLMRANDANSAIRQLKDIRAKIVAMYESLDIQSGSELEAQAQTRTVIRGYITALEQLMTMVWSVHRHANLRSIRNWRKRLIRQAGRLEKRIATLSDTIDTLDALSRKRLCLVISLLHTPTPMAADTDVSHLQRCVASIARQAEAMDKVTGLAVQMRECTTRLDIFCREYSPVVTRTLAEPIHMTANTLASHLEEFSREFSLRAELVKIAETQATIGRIFPTAVTDPNNLGELRRCAMAAIAYLNPIVDELQARTAVLAQAVETALGLTVLPEPLRSTAERRAEIQKDRLRTGQRYWITNGIRAAGGLAAIVFIILFLFQAMAK